MFWMSRRYVPCHGVDITKMAERAAVQQYAAPGIIFALSETTGNAFPLFIGIRAAESGQVMGIVPTGRGRDMIMFFGIGLVSLVM